eukprot:TRINITY_DN10016_c0_g1_i1.p1 TRINITY_DN10016_c0_g1~~TRINITY_DN10016_c0_g1_i1.p1  ORF type:complete len:393 (-),score=122.17 TRINITY_DN10016_c0_g1_i1:47-1225(-)
MQSSKMRSVSRNTLVFSVYSLLLLALIWPMTDSLESSRSSQLHRLSGRRGVVTRVTYQEPVKEHVVVHKVHHVRGRKKKRRRRIRPVAVVPAEAVHPIAGFEGSYVAVSGTPGRGSVHVVENVPALGRDSVVVVNGVLVRSRGGAGTALVPVAPPPVVHPSILHPVPAPVPVRPVFLPVQPVAVPVQSRPQLPAARPTLTGDRLPLPKCSYINTDFPGDDLILEGYTEPGINAGSARACKARCRLDDACSFWTYKEGFSRDTLTLDCFLKEGTPGLPVPREAVPRLGFVSGTQDNNCVCIKSEDEEDEVCPIKEPRGLVYPWRSLDEEENDLEEGLPPLGWNRGVYGGIDPRLGPILGDDVGLEASVRALQAQLDVLTRRLGGRRTGPVRDL